MFCVKYQTNPLGQLSPTLRMESKSWEKAGTIKSPAVQVWQECLRTLKPGGHLISFGGTRTYHRLVCNVEDVGFDVRDMLSWVHSQGFPKSQNVAKLLTKNGSKKEAKAWQDYGTALKPILLARKPLEGTLAKNIQNYGVGALNVEQCRIQDTDYPANFRFPANLIHDGSPDVVAGFPYSTSGAITAAQQVNGGYKGSKNCYGTAKRGGTKNFVASSGNAARFFYCAKPSTKERNCGIKEPHVNHHPTVKPIELMRYLVRLVVPPEETCLDPFMGSGTTGCASILEGRHFIGIDSNMDYCKIAKNRVLSFL